MNINPHLSFENTAIAFASKSTKELRKTYFLFSAMNRPWLVGIGTWITIWALKLKLPVKRLIKKTLFNHFCGGESIQDARKTIDKLAESKIFTILDYSAEGEENEVEFEKTTREQLRIIEFAATSQHLPFSVMKVSGIASNELLEKIHRKEILDQQEKEAYARIKSRFQSICQKSFELDVQLMIDAEETWIQDPIDHMVYDMMEQFNREKIIVWNTYQMYRRDMLEKLKQAYEHALEKKYYLGVKIVRGAYMEKEREMADEHGYTDPIHRHKDDTDIDYNAAIRFCLHHNDRISLFAGTHNDYSSLMMARKIDDLGFSRSSEKFWFGQLYGMSDHISFTLAAEGFNVAKYVPYGPVEKVLPYLFRRAEENTAISGQSSREYRLIKEELRRRKFKN
ncbi:MAG: proline dehydrogenase family protein [Bacteroidetes bacterium]|nr:proline dehydrogenase family protein [Bacteroidota bacterium]MDA1121913.1 proline dehydrogenase family protein [Bacteroidota bacterium]